MERSAVRTVHWIAGSILFVWVVFSLPGILMMLEAKSFERFSAGGVSVVKREIPPGQRNNSMPMLFNVGSRFVLPEEFELTNSKGETRLISVCDGYPDYDKLLGAEPSRWGNGHRVRLVFTPTPVKDQHDAYDHLWFRFARYLRVENVL